MLDLRPPADNRPSTSSANGPKPLAILLRPSSAAAVDLGSKGLPTRSSRKALVRSGDQRLSSRRYQRDGEIEAGVEGWSEGAERRIRLGHRQSDLDLDIDLLTFSAMIRLVVIIGSTDKSERIWSLSVIRQSRTVFETPGNPQQSLMWNEKIPLVSSRLAPSRPSSCPYSDTPS